MLGLAQETINAWLVDPECLVSDRAFLNVIRELAAFQDDPAAEAFDNSFPFSALAEDGAPASFFANRSDFYDSLPDHPRLTPHRFLESFVPVPLMTGAASETLGTHYVDLTANCHSLSLPDRQELARRWLTTYRQSVQGLFPSLQSEYCKLVRAVGEHRRSCIRRVLSSAQVTLRPVPPSLCLSYSPSAVLKDLIFFVKDSPQGPPTANR